MSVTQARLSRIEKRLAEHEDGINALATILRIILAALGRASTDL